MYTIGQFAKKTGVTVRALRFYDEKKLLKPSYLSPSGRRYYNDRDLVVLQSIITFKFLGYSLDHIQEMLTSQSSNLQQSLLRQKQEMLIKKQQLEKTLATLDHALTLAERKESIHTDIFLSLIHGLMMEEQQKQYLKTLLPETLVNDLYNVLENELVEHNMHFMECAEKLRHAYQQKLDDALVFPIIEQMFTIIPQHLMEQTVESSLQLDKNVELDESLFLSPFTKQEEEWLLGLIEKMQLFGRTERDDD
jgi:DNA-binding transcriptional MerR regulator